MRLQAKALAPRADTMVRVVSRGRRILPLLFMLSKNIAADLVLQSPAMNPVREVLVVVDKRIPSPIDTYHGEQS